MTTERQEHSFWTEHMNTFKDIQPPWLDNELFMTAYRRNMELMNTTQQITAEATKAIMQLQTQYMKYIFDQLGKQTKEGLSTASPEEKAFHQSDLAKQAIDQALEHAREINSIIAKSNDKIIERIQKCAKDGVDESISMAKKAKGK